jgi:hypothetical protein
MRAGKLFALAAVGLDIDGVPIEIHGIRALHVPQSATKIELKGRRRQIAACDRASGRGARPDR